jgi:hypothetical protein
MDLVKKHPVAAAYWGISRPDILQRTTGYMWRHRSPVKRLSSQDRTTGDAAMERQTNLFATGRDGKTGKG